uniref:Uncharacterized protein n=1 Tax=Chromera velia CCMP2878 TaxID=1169474 RepID=A0A0G4H506_9ALVE|eukprot:Cvel_5704.t1-p1 / transcript=Cvel_5704.t1 / gene=Cvel_5704 / organism=Chromera_velia_CCMP2878 / gene_product=hypothetical protein / transcript_product=hypothetical protein / location=Cvel_scaffold270:15765-22971(+) / protein_length=751 / sequence_SO=supercontig / SO=protein_coding / is_pseudo=false
MSVDQASRKLSTNTDKATAPAPSPTNPTSALPSSSISQRNGEDLKESVNDARRRRTTFEESTDETSKSVPSPFEPSQEGIQFFPEPGLSTAEGGQRGEGFRQQQQQPDATFPHTSDPFRASRHNLQEDAPTTTEEKAEQPDASKIVSLNRTIEHQQLPGSTEQPLRNSSGASSQTKTPSDFPFPLTAENKNPPRNEPQFSSPSQGPEKNTAEENAQEENAQEEALPPKDFVQQNETTDTGDFESTGPFLSVSSPIGGSNSSSNSNDNNVKRSSHPTASDGSFSALQSALGEQSDPPSPPVSVSVPVSRLTRYCNMSTLVDHLNEEGPKALQGFDVSRGVNKTGYWNLLTIMKPWVLGDVPPSLSPSPPANSEGREAVDCSRKEYEAVFTGKRRSSADLLVVDLYMHSWDLQTLELRLEEEWSGVDLFFLYEYPLTLLGWPRPQVLREALGGLPRFSKFWEKVIVFEEPLKGRVKALEGTLDGQKMNFKIDADIEKSMVEALSKFLKSDEWQTQIPGLFVFSEKGKQNAERFRTVFKKYKDSDALKGGSGKEGAERKGKRGISETVKEAARSAARAKQIAQQKVESARRLRNRHGRSLQGTHPQGGPSEKKEGEELHESEKKPVAGFVAVTGDGDEIVRGITLRHVKSCELKGTAQWPLFAPSLIFKGSFAWPKETMGDAACTRGGLTEGKESGGFHNLRRHVWKLGPRVSWLETVLTAGDTLRGQDRNFCRSREACIQFRKVSSRPLRPEL